jgi:site-specific recombinase XerD
VSSPHQDIEDIEPITVAAYIETLQRQAAPPTVKQHMAAIRMMFSWLTEKGVLAMNPPREVKTERFSRTEGKTPAFVEGEVQKLLEAVETSTHTGLRESRPARGPCLHVRPDRRRRESEGRRLLSFRKTVFAPI